MLSEIKSELLVELSDEQQQVVTGGSYGGYGDKIEDYLETYYKQKDQATILEVTQASGPNGSANVQKFANISKHIDTAAYKDFYFKGNY
jgi:hypothetical protein